MSNYKKRERRLSPGVLREQWWVPQSHLMAGKVETLLCGFPGVELLALKIFNYDTWISTD